MEFFRGDYFSLEWEGKRELYILVQHHNEWALVCLADGCTVDGFAFVGNDVRLNTKELNEISANKVKEGKVRYLPHVRDAMGRLTVSETEGELIPYD